MIKSVQIINGFPTVLPDVGRKEFTFEADGIQVLFGPNGCGKSTLIKTMKAYCGIKTGGWSRISDDGMLGAKSAGQFPYVYRHYTPGPFDAKVVWDGTPTFYNDGDIKVEQFGWFIKNEALSDDGITTEAEQMDLLAKKPSSGQHRVAKISKMLKVIKSPPHLLQDMSRPEAQYIAKLPRNGKPTLLLDEPERALSLPKQKELFEKILVPLSQTYQVIVATHSPFVLFNDNARIINLREGYAEECIEIFTECMAKLV
jgi:predicted ATPase